MGREERLLVKLGAIAQATSGATPAEQESAARRIQEIQTRLAGRKEDAKKSTDKKFGREPPPRWALQILVLGAIPLSFLAGYLQMTGNFWQLLALAASGIGAYFSWTRKKQTMAKFRYTLSFGFWLVLMSGFWLFFEEATLAFQGYGSV